MNEPHNPVNDPEYPLTADDPVAEQVLKVNEDFYRAIETADLDLMREVWIQGADGPSAHCVHPGQSAVHGVEKVLRSWAVVLSRMVYLQFFLTEVAVRHMGRMAVVTCVENILSNIPGDDSGEAGFAGTHFEAVNVFVRDPDGPWRLLAHSSAPVFPADSDEEDGERAG